MTTAPSEQRIIDAMKAMHFTASDARAYLALLKQHPATGYEVATRSGVPRSAIYKILRGLAGQGLVNAVQEKPAKFVPLPPERLFELLESRFARDLDGLKRSLDDLAVDAEEPATWTVEGYPALLEQARSLIRSSQHTLHASLWRREAEALAEPLRAALARGVDIVLFSFNPLPHDLGRSLSYGIPESELEEHWQHRMILVSDSKRLLAGDAEEAAGTRTVITEEPTLVDVAIANLVLDVTLFGERNDTPVGGLVEGLTRHIAPIDELIHRAQARATTA